MLIPVRDKQKSLVSYTELLLTENFLKVCKINEKSWFKYFLTEHTLGYCIEHASTPRQHSSGCKCDRWRKESMWLAFALTNYRVRSPQIANGLRGDRHVQSLCDFCGLTSSVLDCCVLVLLLMLLTEVHWEVSGVSAHRSCWRTRWRHQFVSTPCSYIFCAKYQ